jgi:hypothetical protein
MDKSLRDHVLDLEKRLAGLNAILMEKSRTLAERNNIESEIRATQLVLGQRSKQVLCWRRVLASSALPGSFAFE